MSGYTIHRVERDGAVRFELRDAAGAAIGLFVRLLAAETAALEHVARQRAAEVIARVKAIGSAA